MDRKKLVVIDGKSVLYRGYYAMSNLSNAQGRPTGGTYGFAMMGLRIVNDLKPDYVIVAWDKAKTSTRYRRGLYEDYKANRKPMPEDLREQIPDVVRLCEAFSWPFLEVDDYEADDIMGALRQQAKGRGLDVILATSDLDVLQLVNGHTSVLAMKRGLSDTVLYDEDRLEQEFGMTPGQFIDYKALRGDPSDNIPGVAGVGEKTAKELIGQFGSMDAIYENLDEVRATIRKKLEQYKDMAYLSRELVKINSEVDVELDLEAAKVQDCRPAEIASLFSELGFRRLQGDLPEWMKAEQGLFALGSNQSNKLEPIRIEETGEVLEYESALVVTLEDKALVTPDGEKGYLVDIDKLKVDKIIGFETKTDLKRMRPGTECAFDIPVAAFVLNPLLRRADLPTLASEILGVELPATERKDSIDHTRAGELLTAMWSLQKHYSKELEKIPNLKWVVENIEWPLLPVLAAMEERGMKLDTDYLEDMGRDFAKRIKQLEEKIYSEAGQEFNINSPQQLQTVLFDKLQLSTEGIKKTKTGYSTGASELEKLRSLHPIIDLLSHYRELAKLKSTYIDALPKLVASDGRLHTTLTQTVAQTGRLSSLNPNLQNIPVRTEAGRAIRKAFTAEDGNVLVGADYSQFELRLAAALSGDEQMINAFNEGQDIHVQTAAQLYDIDPGEVSKQQRYNAKAVNFGVMYGLSPHGLSVGTGMSRQEAKEFIDKYFQLRPGLYEYLEGLKSQAKTKGYVETLFGRRRPMPDIHSSNFAVRGAAERAAVNMPLQGTAADLMKLAMIEIDKQLEEDSWQVMQVHDSILIECPKDRADNVAESVKAIMESVKTDIGVRLDVETSIGNNWEEV